MSKFDRQALVNLSKLCRISLTEEEMDNLLVDLQKIIAYVEQLQEIDTSNVAACTTVLEGMSNHMREDEIGECLSREEFLKNAPAHVGGMIRVPPVIKQSK
jgi:aspartyl-tRNA(Asn)/glutamyl-tRNA(Gln) amidotransferase subunit C